MPFGRRTQNVVYWARSSYDEHGEPTVSLPEEITVRWEYGLAQEIRPASNPTAVDATMWTEDALVIGSMVRLTPLKDLPSTPDDVLEVIEVTEVPDIKGRVFERVALLRRYADSLPTVVS